MKTLSEQEPEQQSEQLLTEKNNKAYQSNDIDVANSNMGIHECMQHIGREFVDICHYIILFLISVVVVWTAGKEFLSIVQKGSADLKDILLLFIYLELLAMIGIYFKTHRLPVQFLIFIAITALSRHLVVDVQAVSDNFHLWLLATISFAIMVLSASIVILTWTAKMFGRPEDYLDDHQISSTEHHLPSVDSKPYRK